MSSNLKMITDNAKPALDRHTQWLADTFKARLPIYESYRLTARGLDDSWAPIYESLAGDESGRAAFYRYYIARREAAYQAMRAACGFPAW